MLSKLSNLNSNLTLTRGYLNPALNNSVLVVQTMNSTIHWTNDFPVDDDYENLLHYLLDRN